MINFSQTYWKRGGCIRKDIPTCSTYCDCSDFLRIRNDMSMNKLTTSRIAEQINLVGQRPDMFANFIKHCVESNIQIMYTIVDGCYPYVDKQGSFLCQITVQQPQNQSVLRIMKKHASVVWLGAKYRVQQLKPVNLLNHKTA